MTMTNGIYVCGLSVSRKLKERDVLRANNAIRNNAKCTAKNTSGEYENTSANGHVVRDGKEIYVDNVSLNILPGEAYCLLGIDRAKSVLLRLIGGGHQGKSVYVENENVIADVPITEDVCYVAYAKNPWDFMTVFEYAKYMMSTFVLSAKELDNLSKALSMAGLEKKTNIKLRYLTATEKKLLEMAIWIGKGRTKLIINADDLVFTPRQFNELNNGLRRFKESGKAILISMRDARMVGDAIDNVGIFKSGRIVVSGDPRTVSNLLKKTCYSLRPTGNLKAIAASIKSAAKDCEVQIKGDRILVFSDNEKLAQQIVRAVAGNQEGLKKLTKKEPDLIDALKAVGE